ncbi:uncharacterized protein LOC135400809 [Ornithodoros turicata]|uniref:uncharacterized protein LOC135400809 n=1 Tax=Ornithodoros turicata TaxID=34597 RepID=UPI003139236A
MMRIIFTNLISLSLLPRHAVSTSSDFEVHEFGFMNKSALYLWSRKSLPVEDKLCLCFGPSRTMKRHFDASNCTRQRKGSVCMVRQWNLGDTRWRWECLAWLSMTKAPEHHRPSYRNPSTMDPSRIRCKVVENTTTDLLGDFPGNTHLTFCSMKFCSQCSGGFSKTAYCTSVLTRDKQLAFEATATSDFLVEVKWSPTHAENRSFVVKVCASESGCYTNCFREHVLGAQGRYEVPADLWSFKLSLYVYRPDGVLLFQKKFRSRRLAPDKPCFSTAVVKSWSNLRLYWWPHDDACDGYLVSWCNHKLAGSSQSIMMDPFSDDRCVMEVKGYSLSLYRMHAFASYLFTIRAYRWVDGNRSERLLSRPHQTHQVTMISPDFVPISVLLTIALLALMVTLLGRLPNVSLSRHRLQLSPANRFEENGAGMQRPFHERQIPPIVLRRHSRGDF